LYSNCNARGLIESSSCAAFSTRTGT
jgi:hypothetical protein